MPDFNWLQNKFKGIVLHSTSVREVRQWAGKRVVVFGAGCSGHDICMALSKQGAAEVTMIQRSTTAVISREASLSLFPGEQLAECEHEEMLIIYTRYVYRRQPTADRCRRPTLSCLSRSSFKGPPQWHNEITGLGR
jgi:lysine/ornithine N-monooxygenase